MLKNCDNQFKCGQEVSVGVANNNRVSTFKHLNICNAPYF